MTIRRTITTALAAGALALTFGLATPAAHAVSLPTPSVHINPCLLVPGSCTPTTTVPKGPGDLTQDPCITHACPPPTLPPPVTAPDPTTPSTEPTAGNPATAATPVKATAAFTG
jgi:hypothetical protein